MLCAAIKDCPVFGGKVKSYDESKILSRPGVRRVMRVNDTAVAVVADTWWRAKSALDALPIDWDDRGNAAKSSATIAEQLADGLAATKTNGEVQNGDAWAAITSAAKTVEAVYRTPFLAHATMEPMNCTAKISADKAEVWVATQNSEASLAALSEASGLPLSQCEVYRHDLGGGFGRRGGAQDYVHQAVAIAKEFPGIPVKMIWSREEDMAHDFYRPISQCQMSGWAGFGWQPGGTPSPRLGPVDQCILQSGSDRRRQGHATAAGSIRRTWRCAARLQRSESADRIRHA